MARYVGRFAPTPSGPLHIGSLVAALGSFLCARSAYGEWRLRIDDLDTARIRPEHESTIYAQLEQHGLHWDGAAYRQSEHLEEYLQAVVFLEKRELLYHCWCTRAELRSRLSPTHGEAVYDGHCRNIALASQEAAIRVRVPDSRLEFADAFVGVQSCDLARHVGDFVVRRKDGQFAYQLACAVDETSMGITDVIRGADLVSSSFRQLFLIDQLQGKRPHYGHLPLAMDPEGRKLSKQNHAPSLDVAAPSENLAQALAHLGQTCMDRRASPQEILSHAIDHWQPGKLISQTDTGALH